MCSGNFGDMFKKAMSISLSQRLADKASANSPIAKALGYEGMADPIGDFKHRMSGTESELTKKINRNQGKVTQQHRDAQRAPTGGHIQSIAAMKIRRGV